MLPYLKYWGECRNIQHVEKPQNFEKLKCLRNKIINFKTNLNS